MDDYGNSLHWRRSVVDSPLSGKESPVFGLAAVRPGEDFQFAADNSFGCSFSSPLDWNDEQLRDLMEGDNGDSGDHVVPYPFQSERNVPSAEGEVIINQNDAKASNLKPADRKKTFDLHNTKHAANEALPASAFMDSWPDLYMSKTDQDLSRALESDNAAGTLDGTGEMDSDAGFFQKLDGNVSNMGILDDLDTILSNYNPDFCQTSLPSTQLLHNQLSTRGCENMNDFITPNISSQAFPEPFIKEKIALESGGKAPAFSMELDTGFGAMPDSSLDEVFLEAHSKSKEDHEANQLQDLFRYQPISFDKLNNHYISMNQPCPSVAFPQPVQSRYNSKSTSYPSVVHPRPMQLHYNTGSMPYPGSELASSVSMDFASQYSMPGLSQFRDKQVYQQSVPCSSYVSAPYRSNALKMSSGRPIEGLAMTPKMKVEKLRKQQQMRPMLATQKLQTTDHSVVAHGNFFVEGKSQLERNDSNIARMAVDDHPVKDPILYQLLEIIQKLDTRVKVNIRDSFFRLAQNAEQRQYANNTSGMNTDSNASIVNKEDINNKVETETNLIDRGVAHLLFHQQLSEEFYYEGNPSSSLSFARDFQYASDNETADGGVLGLNPLDEAIIFPSLSKYGALPSPQQSISHALAARCAS
nr:protein LNK2-like isoform X1 [Ipomoea batatas]GMC82288.1 protein LNK2-like isoform X1 [Ipomoea batatas]